MLSHHVVDGLRPHPFGERRRIGIQLNPGMEQVPIGHGVLAYQPMANASVGGRHPLHDRRSLQDGSRRTLLRPAALALLLLGCPAASEDEPVFEPARPQTPPKRLTEPAKIRMLIEIVRTSDLQFIQGGEAHSGEVAAADLERRVARNAAGVATARRFIDVVGIGAQPGVPDAVVLASDDGGPQEQSMKTWLMAQLAEIEAKHHAVPASSLATRNHRQVEILDALRLIDESGLQFVAPARRGPDGKPRGKPKEYTSSEFANMLRGKWELLGSDIHDVDHFIDLIASDAFVSMEPYVVIMANGERREMRGWLLEQLKLQRTERQRAANIRADIGKVNTP